MTSKVPLVVEVALNGVTSKEQNPWVPRTPEEIAADALACVERGASIVHSHADLVSGDPGKVAERYLEAWGPVLERYPEVICYPTVSLGGRAEERFGHIPILAERGAARMGVFDPGSVNLGDLGEDGLPGGSVDFVYRNTFADIRYAAELCRRYRLGPSVSIFEPGFLRVTLAYHRAGHLPPGAFVKLYFGGDYGFFPGTRGSVPFGLPPTARALDAYLEMLSGTGLPWAVAVVGGDVLESGLAARAIELGGHVRVGLEDYGGSRCPRNHELVEEVVRLAEGAGRPVATPKEAAGLLGLPFL
ncbi:MAG: 3-keto-5-aminohexanoate cleavage protein [Candidatus Binatia bacterium]|nr:MAG: 3-keto-5-aminohexanoate cleavage protein [Candidatus Binatia bacterium]